MSMTLQEVLKMPVTSAEEAEAWIKALCDNGFIWHFDDSPEEIIYGKTGEKMFTEDEDIGRARINVAACFAALDDPFETIIAMEGLDIEIEKPELTDDNQIGTFMHCSLCVNELKDGATVDGVPVSPREYARYEFGYTVRGLQVWCVRHECNIANIDFEGHQHPAVTSRKA